MRIAVTTASYGRRAVFVKAKAVSVVAHAALVAFESHQKVS